MARLKAPDREALSDDARATYDRIQASRGHPFLSGPFTALIHSPVIAQRVADVGAYVRYEGTLSEDVRCLAGLMVGRMLNCRFEWSVHVPHALNAGISQASIDAIRANKRPAGLSPELDTVYRFGAQLLNHNYQVDQDVYDETVNYFGVVQTVDLTLTFGYLAMIALPLNAFEVDIRKGLEILPID